jgi:ribosomal protein L11 methyltransferase
MYWLEVSVKVNEETAEIVSEYLQPFTHGAGVVLEQLGDSQNPDLGALLPEVTVKIYIPGDEDSTALRRQIEQTLSEIESPSPIPDPQYQKLEEADWANAWKKDYKAFRVGRRLWIQPSWLEVNEAGPDDIIITLDPGMAFGTGTHATTQMCLQAVEQLVSGGERVLDVGTGSGILAVAAAKSGAAQVVALDTDRLAVKSVIENAAENSVSNQIKAFQGTLTAVSRRSTWDLVLVNILAPVIISLLTQDNLLNYLSPNGRLVLSGIITEQLAEVEVAVQAMGGKIIQRMADGDWVALIVLQGV